MVSHSLSRRISRFVELYSNKLGIKPEILQKTLWGEYYFSPKAKKIYTKPRGDLVPMFVQFCLKNLWEVYQAVLVDKYASAVSDTNTYSDMDSGANTQRRTLSVSVCVLVLMSAQQPAEDREDRAGAESEGARPRS